jgi:hypothetical protein
MTALGFRGRILSIHWASEKKSVLRNSDVGWGTLKRKKGDVIFLLPSLTAEGAKFL